MKTERIDGVCEIQQSGLPEKGRRLLIELPHGATERSHFDALAAQLQGVYPAGLEKFFHVNTDVGAPELAHALSASPALNGVQVTVVRSLIPRTFIDCNRVLGADPALYREGKVTPATPDYVQHPADIGLLHGLLARYESVVSEAYQAVCGEGGIALMLHTYAPRTVPIQAVSNDIVQQLEFHYAPSRIENCDLRPEVDFIHQSSDGRDLVSPLALDQLGNALTEEGIRVASGVSYPLHPSTAAYHHARKFPHQTLCLEVRRDLLVHEWRPFEAMEISPERVAPIARALARGLSGWIQGRET